jgi:predicted permease
MLEIFLKTLPFFALIATGYGAARGGIISNDAAATLTKFVFYFALPAMIFGFASGLDLAEVLDLNLVGAYLGATATVYALVTIVARLRGLNWGETAVEAQLSCIGNNGFLAIPVLLILMGERVISPLLLILSIDLLIFSTLIVVILTVHKQGAITLSSIGSIGLNVAKNPMIVSIGLGLLVGTLNIETPVPIAEFLGILGAAATPCALFAIGASLADKSAERPSVAIWLSFAKLVIHPALAAILAFWVFALDPFLAGVVVATAAMPTAGNIYILAQHYGVAAKRASSTILVSTVGAVATLSLVMLLVS